MHKNVYLKKKIILSNSFLLAGACALNNICNKTLQIITNLSHSFNLVTSLRSVNFYLIFFFSIQNHFLIIENITNISM